MNGIDITCITRINRTDNRPRLTFCAEWLADTGFVSGALVRFIPESDGMSFTLCDENIKKYSELDRQTKEKGGMLMQAYEYRNGLQLCVSGSRLDETGLVYGDKLLVRYEYGFIKMRKISGGDVKLTSSRVIGKRLAEIGFVPDAVLTVASAPGLITCTLHENGLERAAELVKYARENRLKLIQVQKAKYNHKNKHFLKHGEKYGLMQWFDIPPSCLEKAGFTAGDVLLAFYEYGTITLQKPDFAELGF